MFRRNQYPQHFFDRCLRMFLQRKMNPNTSAKVEKQSLVISLPFLGKYSTELKKKLRAIVSKHLKSEFKLNIVWNSPRTLRSFFPFKDRPLMHLRSKLLYRFTCDGCNSIYIGKTKRHFLVRAYEHLGLSIRTGKKLTYNPKNKNNTAVLTHIHQSDSCCGNLDSFKIVGGARNDFYLKIKETLLIKKIKPTLLNQKGYSVPLLLFD